MDSLFFSNPLVDDGVPLRFFKRFLGSTEFINGKERYCLWIADDEVREVSQYEKVRKRIDSVYTDRMESKDSAANKLAKKPHQFRERKGDQGSKLFVPIVSSENREHFPVGIVNSTIVPTNKAFYMPDGPLWALAVISSKIHLTWISTVCGRMRTDFSYSNTLGWNTFPLPALTSKNKADLTTCAQEILIARERHFPATIADLYAPDKMPADLKRAHDRNDEVLERIYIGRRFKNDTERLEKLFELYTEMTAKGA